MPKAAVAEPLWDDQSDPENPGWFVRFTTIDGDVIDSMPPDAVIDYPPEKATGKQLKRFAKGAAEWEGLQIVSAETLRKKRSKLEFR